ncbi:MAG: peptidoglycan pentaglycine glycine transferase (the first glycine) [Oceanicoccus sp.]|jgi:peptidoglycan pentaglycine glycine transferase (the first glycine)
MQIRNLTAEDAGTLSEFLKAHPHGSIEQSWEWGVLQTTVPGRTAFYVLGVFDDKEETQLIASLLVVRQTMGMKKSWLWAPSGPVLPKGDEGKRAWDLIHHEIGALAHRNHDVFVRFESVVPVGEAWPVNLKKVKASYLPRHTLMIDLSLSEDEILAQMAQKGRYNIKKSAKTGVKIRESGPEGLSAFYEILKITGDRDGFSHHKEEFYEQFLSLLEGNAELFLAEIDGETAGGMLVTYFGDRATYYFGASSSKHRKLMAPYSLQWQAIREAKKRGCAWYDFFGIAPEDQPKHPLKGVTQFKTRFGGKRVEYYNSRVLVTSRAWWWLYRLMKFIRSS